MEEVAEAARCLGVHLNSSGKGEKIPTKTLTPPKQPQNIHSSVLLKIKIVAAYYQKDVEEDESVEALTEIIKQEETDSKGCKPEGSLVKSPICQTCQ